MAETLGLCAGPSVEQLQPVSVSSTPLIRASGVLHTCGLGHGHGPGWVTGRVGSGRIMDEHVLTGTNQFWLLQHHSYFWGCGLVGIGGCSDQKNSAVLYKRSYVGYHSTVGIKPSSKR